MAPKKKETRFIRRSASHIERNSLLFQFKRHSDHRVFAYKSYQVLDHYDESPQLRAGFFSDDHNRAYPSFMVFTDELKAGEMELEKSDLN